MAQTAGNMEPLGGADGQDRFRREIEGLQAEISGLRNRLAERAESAVAYVQDEATTVAGTIREHPATATTLFTLVGAIGFAIGYLVGVQSSETKNSWYRRYY